MNRSAIYQQEINPEANSIKVRHMRKFMSDWPAINRYSLDLMIIKPGIEIRGPAPAQCLQGTRILEKLNYMGPSTWVNSGSGPDLVTRNLMDQFPAFGPYTSN